MKKCRYDNLGYWKNLEDCKYYHSGQICDEFLKDGKCKAVDTGWGRMKVVNDKNHANIYIKTWEGWGRCQQWAV